MAQGEFILDLDSFLQWQPACVRCSIIVRKMQASVAHYRVILPAAIVFIIRGIDPDDGCALALHLFASVEHFLAVPWMNSDQTQQPPTWVVDGDTVVRVA